MPECSLCHIPKATGRCPHVILTDESVTMSRWVWERLTDELADLRTLEGTLETQPPGRAATRREEAMTGVDEPLVKPRGDGRIDGVGPATYSWNGTDINRLKVHRIVDGLAVCNPKLKAIMVDPTGDITCLGCIARGATCQGGSNATCIECEADCLDYCGCCGRDISEADDCVLWCPDCLGHVGRKGVMALVRDPAGVTHLPDIFYGGTICRRSMAGWEHINPPHDNATCIECEADCLDYCGCCGRDISEADDCVLWCPDCLGHVGRKGLIEERTWFAITGEECPHQVQPSGRVEQP